MLCHALLVLQVDTFIKSNMRGFRALFAKHSGRFSLPGRKPYMSVEEFLDMLTGAGLFDQEFAVVKARVCFVSAMAMVPDEQRTTKHREMTFVEFLEAVCRCPMSHRPQTHHW